MNETKPPEHQVRRSGLKTSEGIMTAVLVALPMILAMCEVLKVSLPSNSPYLLPVALVAAAISAAGYSKGRAEVKVSRNMASRGPETVAAGGDVKINSAPDSGTLKVTDSTPLESGDEFDENANIEAIEGDEDANR